MLSELPHHLDGDVRTQIKAIIDATVNSTHNRGCDWRKALLLVSAALQKADVPSRVHKMVELLARISGILYSSERTCTPKLIL